MKKTLLVVSLLTLSISCVFVLFAGESHILVYHGQIKNDPITMTLVFNDNGTIDGKYHYDAPKKEIHLKVVIDGRSIMLSTPDTSPKADPSAINDKMERFKGKIDLSTACHDSPHWSTLPYKISGQWEHQDKSFPFQVKVDPFADMALSCDEMHIDTDTIFKDRRGIDLGSGRMSPTSVDYGCKGGLPSLGFLQALDEVTEQIRSDGPPGICHGTIVFAQARYYAFDLLKAGLAPELNLSVGKEAEKTSPHHKYKSQLDYFRVWAIQSLGNFERYQAFWVAHYQAEGALRRHYQKTFDATSRRAEQYADFALRHYVRRAAGSYPSQFQEAVPRLSELDKILMQSVDDTRKLMIYVGRADQKDRDQALKTALLNRANKSTLTFLLENGAHPDSGNESALFFALRNIEDVKLLLGHGANPNYANGFGKTALYYAIERNDRDLVKLLITQGADVNHAYKTKAELDKIEWSLKSIPFYQTYCSIKHTKRTPLMHAAQHGDVDMIELLLSHGADLDAADETGATVVDYAKMGEKASNLDYLRKRVRVNAVTTSSIGSAS